MNKIKCLAKTFLNSFLVIAMAMCCSISLCACGTKTLPKEISQEDWDSYRQYVNLSTGIRMSYVEMGDPNGEVIVLQHGMTDNSRSWSLTAPYFAEAGYHIYMPDLRGQGKSQEADGYYTTVTYATDLKAFFDAMKIDKAIVVGHSLGSYTIQNFWMMFPERCSKVVLVSSLPLKGYQNDRIENAYNSYIKPLADDGHPSDAFMNVWYDCTCKESKYSEVFDTFISNMKKEAQALSKKSWTNIIMGLVTSNIKDAYSYTITNGTEDTSDDYEESLFDKTIPALILHGDGDTMAEGEYQDELCKSLSNKPDELNSLDNNITYKNYTTVAGSTEEVGHNIQFEIPEQFANDVLYWLAHGELQN